MSFMKVKQLIRWLGNFNPEADVVVYEPDHNEVYRKISLRTIEAKFAPLYIVIKERGKP